MFNSLWVTSNREKQIVSLIQKRLINFMREAFPEANIRESTVNLNLGEFDWGISWDCGHEYVSPIANALVRHMTSIVEEVREPLKAEIKRWEDAALAAGEKNENS